MREVVLTLTLHEVEHPHVTVPAEPVDRATKRLQIGSTNADEANLAPR